jgi:hypothetical protein
MRVRTIHRLIATCVVAALALVVVSFVPMEDHGTLVFILVCIGFWIWDDRHSPMRRDTVAGQKADKVRFSLKSLLIVVTIACIGIGFLSAGVRYAILQAEQRAAAEKSIRQE